MPKFKNLLKILLLILLITNTACDNRTEVEGVPVCNYTFTNTTATEEATINIAQDINFIISKEYDYTCDTAYTMRYTVKFNNEVSNNGLFIYNETTQQHNTSFTITPHNFVGAFTALQIGTYQITFIITNGNADAPIQTNTITLVFTD